MEGKTAHDSQCAKSCEWTKVIYLILEIQSFYQKCVIIKGLLNSEQMYQQMVTVGADQSSITSAIYEHICLPQNGIRVL